MYHVAQVPSDRLCLSFGLDPRKMFSLLGCILLCFLGGIYLRCVHRRDPTSRVLDNLPGPQLGSLWTGKEHLNKTTSVTDTAIGNMHEFFDRRGLEFHERLAQNYGPVVRLHGPFLVSIVIPSS